RPRVSSTTATATDPPTRAARTNAGGWTSGSSTFVLEPATVAPMTARTPSPSASSVPFRAFTVLSANLDLEHLAVDDPPRPKARLAPPTPLVVAERHEEVQRVRVEGEPDVGR